ncbi:C-X-C chemokine receptor type 6 [Pseudophryne corroboree]|uniref:C-X-C chemokine receptor type 6 n=1 Tax=Pseudophryne corroboree TaxID=495146 RepID=UPI0030818962
MDYAELVSALEKKDNGTSDPYQLNDLFIPIIYSITCIFGFIGNLLVIIVFVFYEKQKTLTDTFLVNLAIADFLFLCTLPFLAYESVHSGFFGDAMCKITRGMYRINLYTSMLTLTAITFHRFISITKVTKVNQSQVYKERWRHGMCAVIWMLSLLLAVPQLKYSKASENGICIDDYSMPNMELVVQSLQTAIGFLLPLSAMIICYTFIIKTLITARSTQKTKSMRIIFLLVAVFIATQLPYNSLLLLYVLAKSLSNNTHFVRALIVTEAMAFTHACLNPVLYFFIGTKFRNNFWKILKSLGLTRQHEEYSSNIRVTDGDSKNLSASANTEAVSMQRL